MRFYEILVRRIFPRKHCRKFTAGGFTFMELLVIAVIVCVVFLMLFPAMISSREDENTVRCSNNIKQIAQAHHLYLKDYDEYFIPHSVNGTWATRRKSREGRSAQFWNEYLHFDYMGGDVLEGGTIVDSDVWYCPSHELRKWPVFIGYGYNYRVLGSSLAYKPSDDPKSSIPARLSEIIAPSRTVLMTDSRYWVEGDHYGYGHIFVSSRLNDNYNPGVNHDIGLNVGHVDGSVTFFEIPGWDSDTNEGRNSPYEVLGLFHLPRGINTYYNYWERGVLPASSNGKDDLFVDIQF